MLPWFSPWRRQTQRTRLHSCHCIRSGESPGNLRVNCRSWLFFTNLWIIHLLLTRFKLGRTRRCVNGSPNVACVCVSNSYCGDRPAQPYIRTMYSPFFASLRNSDWIWTRSFNGKVMSEYSYVWTRWVRGDVMQTSYRSWYFNNRSINL